MDGPAFLDGLVATITGILSGGYSRLEPDLREMLSIMVGLDLMIAALAWAAAYLEVFQRFGTALLKMLIWVLIFTSYPEISRSFVEYCIWGGLTAGGIASGGELTVEEFQRPSTVIMKGFEATAPINTFIERHSGLWAAVKNWPTLTLMSLGALGIWVAFVVMGLHLVFVLITLEVVLALGVIFIVFGPLGFMGFLAARAFGLIVASAARLGVAALITALTFPYIDQFFLPTGQDPDIYAGAWILIGSWLIAFLSWIIPAIAHGFFAGGPVLGLGTLIPGMALFRGGGGGSSSHTTTVQQTQAPPPPTQPLHNRPVGFRP